MAESNDVKTVFLKKAKETSIVRKPRLARKAAPDGSSEGVAMAPEPLDRSVLTLFRATPRSETATNPVNRERIVRRARRRVLETLRTGGVVGVVCRLTPQESVVRDERVTLGTVTGATSARDEGEVSLPEDRTIDISNLKQFAAEKLSKESVLRRVILLEKTELTPEEFIGRMGLWLNLLDRGE